MKNQNQNQPAEKKIEERKRISKFSDAVNKITIKSKNN